MAILAQTIYQAFCDNPLCKKEGPIGSGPELTWARAHVEGWVQSDKRTFCSPVCQNVAQDIKDPQHRWHVP